MLFLGVPIAVLVVRSHRPTGGFGFDNFVGLFTATDSAFFVTAPEAMTNSLLFAFAALVIAVVIGAIAVLKGMDFNQYKPLIAEETRNGSTPMSSRRVVAVTASFV